ncbi:uncharacterized protein LOC110116376, partial [Dendrobium catenatum]|uniref:uncharacterized protein LOC110116376 n=1 Tax=Dendrobium catenatum TaxID=906689 RepID=UPI0009F2123D
MFGEGWDFFYVPSEGLSGGILLIWKQGMASFKVVEASTQFVVGDLEVLNKGTWRIATIYGSKDVYRRRFLWDGLDQHMVKDVPMIIGGDLNCFLSKEEKKGGRKFLFSLGTKEMKSFIYCNDLHEVTCVGPKFTWCNNKKGPERIMEKLDRCLINYAAFNSPHRLMERHLARIASDHNQILLNLLNFSSPARKFIRFEEEKETDIGDLSKDEQWKLKAKIEELNSVLARINTTWRQRAKVKWLTDGDSNSIFFQAFASARRNLNYIHNIKNEQGDMVEDQKNIEEVLFRFFNIKWEDRECILNGWPVPIKTLEEVDKKFLNRGFTIEELEKVIKGLGGNIAPGQD